MHTRVNLKANRVALAPAVQLAAHRFQQIARLFLFHSRKRTLRGESRETRPSPYLADLEEALLERGKERAARSAAAR